MELKYNLHGCQILEILKIGDQVKLRFSDPIEGAKLSIFFDGIIFETPSVKLNSRVIRAELTNVLGFKAMNQLTH